MNRTNSEWRYQWEDSGGYDCMTPACLVFRNDDFAFAIDAKDHGWNAPAQGSGASAHRTEVMEAMLRLAREVVAALNNRGKD